MGSSPANTVDGGGLVERLRASAGPDMVPSRAEAEDQARSLLDAAAGRMSVEQAHELARILNRGSWGGTLKHNRFLPAFSVPLIDQMVADLDRFNDTTQRLWRGSDEEALSAADEIFRDAASLPGSGRSYPSVLLYLRDSSRFCIWLDSVDRGLAALTTYEQQNRAGGSEAYETFCSAALELAASLGLKPQEVDAVLAEGAREVARRAAAERERLEIPTITAKAFEFLQGLRDNSNKDWFDEHRAQYEQDLRDPLAAVLQYVADKYIVGLDPEINTEVKRDAVMARINKFTRGDPYYTYLWGAFSRGRKQEDVQLYVSIHDDFMEYGLALGSAAPEARQLLAAGIRQQPEIIDAVLATLGDAELGLPSGPAPEMKLAEVVAAAEAGDLRIVKVVAPDDGLIGSDRLAADVGRVLEGVYPLAALAWGLDVEFDEIPDDVEPSRSVYTLEQLAADTLLPAEQLEEWIGLLRGPKRAGLFYGPPGTGKTYVVERLARYLAGTSGETKTVQFHPSFSYEDFIEGLRPTMEDGQLGYHIRDGVFKTFCENARGKDSDHVFVIDEINRAELGSVLGEVMMLIEYRERAIPLPYSQRPFSIPRNVVLLATMNTADRSLALVDFALRRRFHAVQMLPDRDVLTAYHGPDGGLAASMFDIVTKHVDSEDYAPGQTYWMLSDATAEGLQRLWSYELRPYLSEYWFESKTRLDELEKEVLALLGEGA